MIEDGFSRLVMGWALSLYPTSAEVLVAVREAIVIDPEREPWGGGPQLIRFDGGREFPDIPAARRGERPPGSNCHWRQASSRRCL